MDVKKYIETGILEEYVSGLLTDEENREVDRVAGLYPEVQEEIDQIRSAYNLLSNRLGLAPNESVLEQSLAKINKDAAGNISAKPRKEEVKTEGTVYRYMMAASVVLLVMSVALNGYFFSELTTAREEIQNMTAFAQSMQSNLDQANQQLAFIEDAINLKIPLNGSNISPASNANVYWNTETSDVYIHIGNLPAPPSGHQYQLWAEKDGHMHNIGTFHHNTEIQHLSAFAGAADAFNVTLELEGGSEEATVDKLYLRGSI